MALDPAHVGRRYPPTEPYEVSRVKIREFADAIGDGNPIYRDAAAARASGHPDVVAPPTFAVVIAQPATKQASFDPALGIDYAKVVHGEQRFTHVRALRPGDLVTAEVEVTGIRSVGGNDLLTTTTELRAGDELVCTAVSTLVVRGGVAS